MEDRLEAKIVAGRRAHAELELPALKSAFEQLDAQFVERWRATRDPEERDRIWHIINVLELAEDVLRRTAANGRVAQAELDDLIAGKPRAAA